MRVSVNLNACAGGGAGAVQICLDLPRLPGVGTPRHPLNTAVARLASSLPGSPPGSQRWQFMPSVIQPTASVPPPPCAARKTERPAPALSCHGTGGGGTDRHDASQEREHLLQGGRGYLWWVLKDEQKFTRCSRGERI